MVLIVTYAVCLASGLVPIVNAELYLAALSAAHGGPPLLLALFGTLGQMSPSRDRERRHARPGAKLGRGAPSF